MLTRNWLASHKKFSRLQVLLILFFPVALSVIFSLVYAKCNFASVLNIEVPPGMGDPPSYMEPLLRTQAYSKQVFKMIAFTSNAKWPFGTFFCRRFVKSTDSGPFFARVYFLRTLLYTSKACVIV